MMMMMSLLVSNVDANADDDSIAWQSKNHMLVIPTIPTGTTMGGSEEDHNRHQG